MNVNPRLCPLKHGKLIEREILSIKIDYCLECNGVFFDRGELQQLTGIKPKIEKDTRVEKLIICPNCDKNMQYFEHPKFPGDKGAFLCPFCAGVFVLGETLLSAFDTLKKHRNNSESAKALLALTVLEHIDSASRKPTISEFICPFDSHRLEIHELPDELGKKIKVKRCAHCGSLYFERGQAYRVNREEVLKLDEKRCNANPRTVIPEYCPFCKGKMRPFIHPKIKGKGIGICVRCYGTYFRKGRIKNFEEFVRSKKAAIARDPRDAIAISLVREMGADKSAPYLDALYFDLREKAKADRKSSELMRTAFLAFLLPFSPSPLRLLLFFADDIIEAISGFFKLKGEK